MLNDMKNPKKSNKSALLIAVSLITLLIIIVIAIVFLIIKQFENKESSVQSENYNQSINEEAAQNEEIKPNKVEQAQQEYKSLDKEIQTDKIPEVLPEGKYVYLPVEMKIYNKIGDIVEQNNYNWIMYKDNTNYSMNYTSIVPSKSYTSVDSIRSGSREDKYNKVFMEGKEVKELSAVDRIMYHNNTNIIIEHETTLSDGVKMGNQLQIQHFEKTDNITFLNIHNKFDNTIKKIQIAPDNKRQEDIYLNNKHISSAKYEDYYYKDIFLTTLNNTEYYNDDKVNRIDRKQLFSIEELDNHSVKITFKHEDVNYSEDEKVSIENTIEYILYKHLQDDANLVIPVYMKYL